MKLRHRFLHFAALPFVLSLPLSAAVVLETGFESYALGNLPTTTSLPVYDQNNQGTREIRSGDDSPFGTGQYLALGGANLRARSNGLTTLTTISFDFYEPVGSNGSISFGFGAADINGTGSYLSWDLNNGTISAAANTQLDSGALPSLEEDRHYVAQILLNRSTTGEIVNLPNGDTFELAANQAALFFLDTTDGTLIDGGTYTHTASVTPSTFFFRSFSTGANLIYVDNYQRQDVLSVVPEPSVALLGGIGLLGLLRRRRA